MGVFSAATPNSNIINDIWYFKFGITNHDIWHFNFASWEYKVHQYLVGEGYWTYIEGAHETQTNPTHADYPSWEQVASRVLYCLASCVHDHMMGYIREAKTPKEAWGNLKKIFAPNTVARKLQPQ